MGSNILQPGTIFAERYRIDRLIGSGGFARIYRAIELGLERPVALKVLSTRVDSKLEHSPVRERFMREAQLISRLNDPRTITIYGYDSTDDGLLYMALEYVDGVDLRVLLDTQGALSAERIVPLVTQILLGLREAHVQDCLHRDIKPSNIMVYDRFGERDCVKLLDFGIAKAVLAEHKLGQDLTREGGVIGTPGYMSPEQLMGRPLTAATDLFSLGVVTYEMFTGRSPYPSRDPTEIHRRMQSFREGLGPLEAAPQPLRSVCRRMLHPDVEHRASTAEELLAILGRENDAYVVSTSAASSPSGRAPIKVRAEKDRARTGPRPHTLSISFPLGLDPAGHTPSTELTAVRPAGVPSYDPPTLTISPAPRDFVTETSATSEHARGESLEPVAKSREKRRFTMIIAAVGLLGVGLALATYLTPGSDPSAGAQDTSAAEATVSAGSSAALEAQPPEIAVHEQATLFPELVEAFARARAHVELGATLASRQAQEKAREASAERRVRPRERVRQRSRPEPRKTTPRPAARDVEETFEIEAFE